MEPRSQRIAGMDVTRLFSQTPVMAAGKAPGRAARVVVVVGGGHAGVEAALAARRLGLRVRLITLDPSAIGRMSCNPSIGGLAKGQLAREVDALGGLMGMAADQACVQFRMLNTRKGPAVQSPRAQTDREAYAAFVQDVLRRVPDLEIVTGQVAAVRLDGEAFRGFELTDGSLVEGAAGVLTTGTFLRGLMHVGDRVSAGGRIGEAPAQQLSQFLCSLGLELIRLKTGTPPRIDRRSVDLTGLDRHEGSPDDGCFSFRVTPPVGRPSLCTWRTDTGPRTHELIRQNLDRSPYGRGALEGTGPRYCPSLEDKVVRFAEREHHRVFIERETVQGDALYLNGLSNCLPADVQTEVVRSVPGLAGARLLRPGYAVEYDAVPAHQLRATLECRAAKGLFLAGQINGTSGYEEAAAQGLMAGLNAARAVLDLPAAVLGRHEAYVGVLIDDLVTCDPREPYRMFTSRAEFRLLLRQDNADRRLVPRAAEWGLVDQGWAEVVAAREQRLSRARRLLGQDDAPAVRRLKSGEDLDSLDEDAARAAGADLDQAEREQLQLDVRYAGYVERQQRAVEHVAALAGHRLAADLDYQSMAALRTEAREVLARIRPENLAQASRLAGVTSADVQLLALSVTAT